MMRILASFLILPSILIGQVPNNSFEDWITYQTEEPSGWLTNNYPGHISIMKTVNSFSGDYAARISSNAPGIEGPMPGWLRTTIKPDQVYNQLTLDYLCDSVLFPGYGEVIVTSYNNGIPSEIGRLEVNEKTICYLNEKINLDTSQKADSLEIRISANTVEYTTHYAGYFSWIIDDFQLVNTSSYEDNLSLENIVIYPNPSSQSLYIKIPNGIEASHVKFTILDINYRIFKTFDADRQDFFLNIDELNAGTYILEIRINGSLKSMKLIIN